MKRFANAVLTGLLFLSMSLAVSAVTHTPTGSWSYEKWPTIDATTGGRVWFYQSGRVTVNHGDVIEIPIPPNVGKGFVTSAYTLQATASTDGSTGYYVSRHASDYLQQTVQWGDYRSSFKRAVWSTGADRMSMYPGDTIKITWNGAASDPVQLTVYLSYQPNETLASATFATSLELSSDLLVMGSIAGRPPVIPEITDATYTLTLADCLAGIVWVNHAGIVTVNLPDLTGVVADMEGRMVTLVMVQAHALTLDTDAAGETLWFEGASATAADVVSDGTAGASITVIARNATQWWVIGTQKPWSD